MWRATFKGMLAHRLRLALTALAVALGVAFVAGTFILTDTTRRTVTGTFTRAAGGRDVVVGGVSRGGRGGGEATDALAARVRAVPGVAAVAGVVGGSAPLVAKDGSIIVPQRARTLGASWPADPALAGAYQLRQGSPPAGPGEVVLDAATARGYGFHLGDGVRVALPDGAEAFRVVGIAGFGGADGPGGATLALFDTATAQRLFGKPGRYDELDVRASAGTAPAALRDRVAAALPPGFEAVTGDAAAADEAARQLSDRLGFFTGYLVQCGLLALFVAGLLIWNTFAILLFQRSRELALLRVLGATRGQVLRGAIAEAALLGVVASLAGVALGAGAARALKALLEGFGVAMPTTGLVLEPRTVAVALLLGSGTTVLAAAVPARHATRVAPVEALREAVPAPSAYSRARAATGLLLVAAGAALIAADLAFHAIRDARAALDVCGAGGLIVFLGVAVLNPVLVRPLAWLLGRPVAALAGVTGRFGRDNAMRNPKRTAATTTALMLGLAVVAFTEVVGASLVRAIDASVDRSSKADFILTVPDGSGIGIKPEIAPRIAALPGVAAVTGERSDFALVAGTAGQVTAVDPATAAQVIDLDLRSGSLRALGQVEGGVLVFVDLARAKGLRPGSAVPLEGGKDAAGAGPRRRSLTVVGTFADKRMVRSDYVVSLATAARLFDDHEDNAVGVRAAPGADRAALQAAIRRVVAPWPAIRVDDAAAYKRAFTAAVTKALGLVVALLGLAVVIAFLGIVNTLALSVFERTRELGLLRAIGMTRGQLAAAVRWEAVLVALLGATSGILLGVALGGAIADSATRHALGATTVALPVARLAAAVALAGAAGVLAAVTPARRAARLDVLDAIGAE